MPRSLLLLALATLFVGCKSASKSAAKAGSSNDVRFSWEKDAVAAVDPNRVTIQEVRADLSLLQLSAIEKRDPNTRLQLTKAGKKFVVQVIKSDESSMVVAIAPGSEAPELRVGDDLPYAVLAQ